MLREVTNTLREVPMFECLNRGDKRFETAKVNSRCFHWFPATMLESLRRAPTWLLHTKHFNFL